MNFREKRRTCVTRLMSNRALFMSLLYVVFFNFSDLDYQTASTYVGVQNVVLVSIDTLRADYLGCYNRRMKTSSHLDSFASENILFTNATSQAPSTAISHKSILYSLYPSIHKTSTDKIPQEELQSPLETLQAHGFKTAAFVGGGQLSAKFGFAKGFNSYWEADTYSDMESTESLDKLAGRVSDWLDKNYHEKFFLFVHTYEMHCPYYPPKQYRDKYTGWYKGDIDPKGKCGDNFYNKRKLSNDDLRFVRDLYSAQVEYIDDFLKSIFEKLKALGLYDKTLIIALSDHGESLGEREYIGHNLLYEKQLRIPLIIHLPVISSRKVESPVQAIDIMPTVFHVLGIDPPFPFQGRNLVPLISGQVEFPKDRTLMSEQSARIRVRKGNMAAIFDRDGNSSPEVYDLTNDPDETKNIASRYSSFMKQCKAEYSKIVKKSQSIGLKFVIQDSTPPALDDEIRKQLKSLGYIN